MYDNEGNICGIRYGGDYYFQKNLQGDVIAIKDSKGNTVARYRYDAWGVPTIVEDITLDDEDWDEDDGIATINPFRYRGYYYDNETGLYYLQSRYYDPTVGRFINADSPELCVSPSKYSIKNIFAYGDNNLVNNADYFGTDAIWLQDMDNVGGLGHTGLLLHKSGNLWKHFFWGTNGIKSSGKSGSTARLSDFYGIATLSNINILYNNVHHGKYEDMIYFKGNFSKSITYANNLKGNYSLIWNNCLQVSIDVLSCGWFYSYNSAYKTFLFRLRTTSKVPNIAYARMLTFYNAVQKYEKAPRHLKPFILHPSIAALKY